MEPYCRRPKLVLSIGSVVEVARGDGGSGGAWYVAKIVDVESPPKQSGNLSKVRKILVEYEQLVSKGEAKPLVEWVETRCIRPLPPSLESKQCSFELDDSVEAKWRNGWWHGIVKMVLEDSRYCLCIDGSVVDDVFESSDLREHWSWSRGRWYRTEKKKKEQENGKQKTVEFNDTVKCAIRRSGKFTISRAKFTNTHKPGREDNAGSAIKRVVQTLMQEDGFPRLGCVLGLQAEERSSLTFADTGQIPNKELGNHAENCEGKSHKRKRRKPQKLVVKRPEVPETGGPDASRKEGYNGSGIVKKKNDLCNAETSNTNEDQPLSTCSEGIRTPTCIEGSSESMSGESKCLFMKTSPVWKMFESMKIFRTTPQNPHFSPLWVCKEGYREGAAIGIMATFASLTDKISNLLFDDPRHHFDGCLETICDMEKHGFEVTALQSHVNELLTIKEKQELLQDKLKDAELEIADKECEKRGISEEMEAIDKEMTNLRAKYALLNSEKEKKDVEIARLRTNLKGNNEQISSVRLEFEQVAALLPWKSD